MAEMQIHPTKTCSKCGLPKLPSEFAAVRTNRGRLLKRAHCRACYNAGRRTHYSLTDVYDEKRRKRLAYESKQEVAQQRRHIRSLPENKIKERLYTARYRARPEKQENIRRQSAAYRAKPEKKALTLYTACRWRALKKGLPFDLTEEWVRTRVCAGTCELTGLTFVYEKAPNGWLYNPFAPSIDQITAGAGYTMANCRVVLTSLNNALSQYGDEHFEKVALAFLMKRGYRVMKV